MRQTTLSSLVAVIAALAAGCGASTPAPTEPAAPGHDGPRIAAGRDHTCVVTDAGDVLCWGSNDRGQLGDASRRMHSSPQRVPGLHEVLEVTAGFAHTCALRRDGSVYCWGAGLHGQLGNGASGEDAQAVLDPVRVRELEDAEHIASGAFHTCALRRGGRIACWGDDAAGQLGTGEGVSSSAVPVDLEVSGMSSLTAGDHHTCALDADGAAHCWGLGDDGQLGTGDAQSSAFPALVTAPEPFTRIVAGRAHTCAQTERGVAYCWGQDEEGQVGDGHGDARALSPTRVGDLGTVATLSSGGDHTCARLDTHEVFCWGSNQRGQLGDGTLISAHHPVPGPVSGVEIAAGSEHTCVLHDWGMVTCWGDNGHGQLGDGRIAWQSRPAPVRRMFGATSIAAGGNHSCAVRPTAAMCWGSNLEGELGLVGDRAMSTPVATIVAAHPSEISLALGRTCVREETGAVLCTGHGMPVQDPPDYRNAVELEAMGAAHQIAVSRDFACALNTDGAIGCWGDNEHGQLGDGTLERRETPAAIEGAGEAREIAVGASHACARVISGSVFCWGANNFGQLGDGTHEDRSVPTPVEGVADAQALALGRDHSCALRRDGSITCWGGNRSGQLGDGTRTSRPTAAPVRELADVTAIASGWVHTCARTQRGRVHCWGENRYGQLGRDTEEMLAASPAPVVGLTVVEEIATGGVHTCARLAGGEVSCWGSNAHGQLGDGATLLATRPVMARLPTRRGRGE